MRHVFVLLNCVFAASSLVLISACGGGSSGGANSGSTTSGSALDPVNSTTPYSMTASSPGNASSTPLQLFPSFGDFYVNPTPSITGVAGSAGQPWFEFQITFSQCFPKGGVICTTMGPRVYIHVQCPGYINDPAGCESAATNLDLANLPSGIVANVILQSVDFGNVAPSLTAGATSGTLQIHRLVSTPRPAFTAPNALLDNVSKFDLSLSNLNFGTTAPVQISFPNFQGEFWGGLLISNQWK